MTVSPLTIAAHRIGEVAVVRAAGAGLLARVCADGALPAYPDVAEAIEGLMFSGEWR